eukprot:TRINITY_DN8442_c0_g2_i1.p1 TRINITY_DN8442_c0_g2~~TRINITY_DN8442_c0_g2_i1.p1  ORF type:complete len:1061 (-),score=181.13 TRINITY_DN8442_c0_g2_i1:1732-4914(-)
MKGSSSGITPVATKGVRRNPYAAKGAVATQATVGDPSANDAQIRTRTNTLANIELRPVESAALGAGVGDNHREGRASGSRSASASASASATPIGAQEHDAGGRGSRQSEAILVDGEDFGPVLLMDEDAARSMDTLVRTSAANRERDSRDGQKAREGHSMRNSGQQDVDETSIRTDPSRVNSAQLDSEMLALAASMKEGRYIVHIHIAEAIQLRHAAQGQSMDPVAEVKFMNSIKTTAIVHRSENPIWDRTFSWNIHTTPIELLSSLIRIFIYNSGSRTRKELIGMCSISAGEIYRRPGHEFQNAWLALTGEDDRSTQLCGYLRAVIKISPLNDEDEVPMGINTTPPETIHEEIILPPQLSVTNYALVCLIYKAEGLPKVDAIGKSDPYVKLIYEEHEMASTCHKKTLDPVWNEEIRVPVRFPTLNNLACLQLYDQDQGSSDDIIASHFINVSEMFAMKDSKYNTPFWINFYGAPVRSLIESAIDEKMNEGIIPGIEYKGRILVQLYLEKLEPNDSLLQLPKADDPAEKPFKKIEPIADPPSENYSFQFDLYDICQGSAVGSVYVRVKVGLSTLKSKPKVMQDGVARWNTFFDSVKLNLPKNEKSWPDVLISVKTRPKFGKGHRIGTARFKLNTFLGQYNDAIWAPLQAYEDDTKIVAGNILFRINFGRVKDLPLLSRESPPPQKTKEYTFNVYLYCGKDIPAADANGLSDPVCEVRIDKYKLRSKELSNTLRPVWNEVMSEDVVLPQPLNLASQIILELYDVDFTSDQDLLGRYIYPTNDVHKMKWDVPQWLPLYMPGEPGMKGQVLIAFELIPKDQTNAISSRELGYVKKPWIAKIDTLGLREMIPYQGYEINNPQATYAIDKTKITAEKLRHCHGGNANLVECSEDTVELSEKQEQWPDVTVVFSHEHPPLLAKAASSEVEGQSKKSKKKEPEKTPPKSKKQGANEARLIIGSGSIPLLQQSVFKSPYVMPFEDQQGWMSSIDQDGSIVNRSSRAHSILDDPVVGPVHSKRSSSDKQSAHAPHEGTPLIVFSKVKRTIVPCPDVLVGLDGKLVQYYFR